MEDNYQYEVPNTSYFKYDDLFIFRSKDLVNKLRKTIEEEILYAFEKSD